MTLEEKFKEILTSRFTWAVFDSPEAVDDTVRKLAEAARSEPSGR